MSNIYNVTSTALPKRLRVSPPYATVSDGGDYYRKKEKSMFSKFREFLAKSIAPSGTLIGVEATIGRNHHIPGINDCSSPITFNVYSANGGMIIETRQYNTQRGEMDATLYIVPQSEIATLGERLGNIVTLEAIHR